APGRELQPQAAVPADAVGGSWRAISAELLAPPGAQARVCVGVQGPGAWHIDRIALEPADAPEAPQPGEAPVFSEDLPPGWEPRGLLDAIERPVAGTVERLVNCAGLEIVMPAEVTAARGHRGAVRLAVHSRSTRERELTVGVAGPPGTFVPERTVPIAAGGTTVFRASVQSLLLGRRRVCMTFRSRGEDTAAPLTVEVTPSFPALGAAWLSTPPAHEELAQLRPLDLQMHAVRIPAADAATAQLSVGEALTRVLLLAPPWAADTVAAAGSALAGPADFVALHHAAGQSRPDDAAALTRQLRESLGDRAWALGPAIDLAGGAPPEMDEADVALAGGLGAEQLIAAPTLRLP
ncbi:MAG: hypothetical protein U9Q74_15270, partial [Gemmatimonadota bacterium]|nr:hypothetical protein [Gemmatimonadota bacterium]